MKFSQRTFVTAMLVVGACFALVALAGEALAQGADNPVVIVKQPPSNSAYLEGDIISVESLSASPVGIVQVDLLVDGKVVRTDMTPGELPEVQFSLIQRWIANLSGNHVITVRATDSENRVGQASINVSVQAQVATPVPTATAAPPPTPTPNTCLLNSVFVRDVTIPDNTVLSPGAVFVKTWMIQNNGTCAWDPGTVAVFTGGTRMAGASPTPVGSVAPGATTNISINFVAPATPGTFRSGWRLQSGNGTVFGQAFFVQIVVPGPPTPIPPPPPPVPTGCQGKPYISSFTADTTTLQRGQGTTLRWGLVSNADSVYLQSPAGSGGVPSPGSTGVNPNQTTTYTLAAFCKGVQTSAPITITVHGGGGGGGGGGAHGSIDGMEVGNKGGGRWQVRVYYSWNGKGGPAQVCATAPGSSTSPCTNARANAPYAVLNLNGKHIGQVTACLNRNNGAQIACGTN